MLRRILMVLFLGYTAIWTSLLLVPDITRILWIPADLPAEIARSPLPADKLVHGLGYFGLMVLGAAAFYYDRAVRPIVWLSGAALVHGVATELAQRFIPNRSADLMDLVADAFGILLGLIVVGVVRRLALVGFERG